MTVSVGLILGVKIKLEKTLLLHFVAAFTLLVTLSVCHCTQLRQVINLVGF